MNGKYGVIIKDLCELLYIEGNIAGGIVAALDEGELYIVTLAVLPEYRGKNLSLNLLSRLLMKAQEKGYEKIVLYVTDSNIPAINIYNKAGFEVQKGT
jgi:predicted acetyltransferase